MRHRVFHRLPTGELIDRRGVIASALALGALTAGLVGGTSAASALVQSKAAGHAADVQASTADKTLAYQREQAALDAQRYEAAQKANYAQYVNRVHGAQALGAKYGYNSIPDPAAYVPTPMGPQGGPQVPPSPFGPRAIGNYLPRGN